MSVKKPAYSSSIVQVTKDHTIPETLLHKLVTENPTALGIAVRDQKGISVERHKLTEGPAETINWLKKIESKVKPYSRMYTFHSYPADYDEDVELQPYVLLKTSNGSPLICVGIEGDFPKYVDTSADGFSEAYMLLNNWLGPKVLDMYKLLGNNPQKIYDFLRTEQFAKDFDDQIGYRGCLYFLPNTGEMFSQSKNEAGVDKADWGACSFAYGYTEPVIEAATAEAKPEVPVAPKEVKAQKSKWADDDEPVVEPAKPVVVPKVDDKPVTSPTEKVAAETPTSQVLEPPKGMHGKPLKEWYRSVTGGELPIAWRERPKVTISVKPAKTEPAKTETAISASMTVALQQKQDKQSFTNSMPVISGEKLKAANEFVKKYLGDGSALITDPTEAGKMEAKLAKFAELMAGSGITSITDFQKMTTAFKFAFVAKHPEAAALALIEMSNHIRDLEENGDKKLGELTGTKETSTPEQVTPEPEPAKKAASGGVNRWT